MIFLGTGTSVGVPLIGCRCPTCASDDARNRRTRCSVLWGLPRGNVLIDTAVELRLQLVREGIGLIQAVLYTHEHADHVLGLDDLRIFQYYLGGPVPLYCEARVEERIRQSFDYAFAERAVSATSKPKLVFRRIAAGEPFELCGATILPLRLRHGGLDILGFRVGDVAYCTDTNEIPDETWPLLKGLDVLVLGALGYKPHPTHFSLEDALQAAQRIGARRTLLTHIGHALEHATTSKVLPPGTELAYDGLHVPLAGVP